MNTTFAKITKSVLVLTFVLSLVFLSTADRACGQSMTLCPFKIVLNQQGNTESVQAVIPMTLDPGYMFSDCNATLSIGGVVIAENYGAKYCYIDDNLLVYFERDGVISSEALAEMANTFQEAKVEGTLIMVNTDGDILNRGFDATDDVEIVDPDHKGQ
jgi:hypothetical protein